MTGISSLALAVAAAWSAPQTGPATARVPRDPDRGLPQDLRALLKLADPALDDQHPGEQWAALVEPRLRDLALDWSRNEFEGDLPVGELAPRELEVAAARGAWSVERPTEPTERILPLSDALAAWRAQFDDGARLELEIHEVELLEGGVLTRVRVTAWGASAGDRVQHNARWTCRWRRAEAGVELVQLTLDAFESVRLASRPAGLFEDATAALLAAEPEVARQLASGVDEWRRTIPASLEPGTLGHHGLALGDVDGDGLEDLYLCQPGGLPNRLLMRLPDGSLRDASAEAGVDLLDYSSSALLADFDGDGDADLVVSTAEALLFFANDGRGRFERRLARERSLAMSLAAADFDADGDLDLYACSYLSPYEHDDLPLPYHAAENGAANQLLRNDGAWAFADATVELGLDQNNRRFSFAAAWEDFDDDGDLDLYVANDFGRNNLYRQEAGRFRDVAAELGVEDVSAGMGVSWGDADGDGRMDLYVTNMFTPAASRLTLARGFREGSPSSVRSAYRDHAMGNSLLLNRGARPFAQRADESGTNLGRWGWGAVFVDFDNDGAGDLFAPNGFSTGESARDLDSFFWRRVVLRSPDEADGPSADYALGWRAVNRLVRQGWSWNGNERNAAWLNLGEAVFVDVSGLSGLDVPDDSRATARVDWDGDGDLDLLVTGRTAPQLRLFVNRHDAANDWIAFELESDDPRRTVVGSRVTVTTQGGRKLVESLRCGEGFLAQSSSRVHFGLGDDEVASVAVRWPGGAPEEFGAPAKGVHHRLRRGSGEALALERATPAPALAAGVLRRAEPSAASRTVLPVPLPMAQLQLETTDGRPAAILGIGMDGPRGTGQPLLLMVWGSFHPEGRRALEELAAGAEDLLASRVQVLAVLVDVPEQRERALAVLREIAWPFSSGFAGEDALLVLEQIQGALRESYASLEVPAGFLISPRGELLASYTGTVAARLIVADLALFELEPQARRDAATPFGGRWFAPMPAPFEPAVAARLSSHGLERSAAEYRLAPVESSALSGADFQVELGLVRQRQGRVDEAVRLFREALAVDPRHARAAQSLAMALHGLGEREQALVAYRRAVELDPSDEPTRANLGALLLDLGDLEGARAELEALQQRRSELAPALEELIRQSERRR